MLKILNIVELLLMDLLHVAIQLIYLSFENFSIGIKQIIDSMFKPGPLFLKFQGYSLILFSDEFFNKDLDLCLQTLFIIIISLHRANIEISELVICMFHYSHFSSLSWVFI